MATKMGMKNLSPKKPMRKVSEKMAQQLKEEKLLTLELYEQQDGLCAECGKALGFGSAKHEKVFRSHGGSAIDKTNTILLCLVCHSARHGIKVVED